MKTHTKHMNITEGNWDALSSRLLPYRDELRSLREVVGYRGSQDSIKLAFDESIRTRAQQVADKRQGTKLVVVIGIGGSNLGTKAVYEALGLAVRMEFIDTVDPLTINRAWAIMSLYRSHEVVVCVVSKSGQTIETIANVEIILERMKRLWGEAEAANRMIVISDEESPLYLSAQKSGYETISHEHVGGRYSVLSSVGLVPLAIAGCDIQALHEGARSVVDELDDTEEQESAFRRAVCIYAQYQAKRRVHNTFVFNPELASTGAWYRQLVGESLGKKHNLDGEEVHSGMVPTTAVGSTDLHSMAQLYLSDPGLITTTCIYVPREGLAMPEERSFSEVVPMLEGESTKSIMSAIYRGTTKAFEHNEIPFGSIELDEVSAHQMGALLQMYMLEVMYLAYLMNIDAFDQPSVEEYKKVTKEILDR